MSKCIVSIGTGALGGIDSVIKGYCENGLFNEFEHIRIISHMGNGKFYDLYLFFLAMFKLVVISLRKDFILHCHMSYKGSFWRKLTFMVIAKAFRNKTIVHLHGSEFKDYFSSSSVFVRYLIVFLITKSDYFVVLSDGWADYIFSITGRKVHVINNYVDIKKIDIDRKCKDILFLGAFIKRKGIYDLLQACSMLSRPYHLHLCGEGETEKVKFLANKLNMLDNITFHGWVGIEQKKKLLSSCGVMILPTYNEGLPMTIIESMACEIPIISSPVGAIPEVIIDGKTGYLIDAGNIDSIKSKLDYVLSASEDLDRITHAARSLYLKKFCSKVILPKWKEIYNEDNQHNS